MKESFKSLKNQTQNQLDKAVKLLSEINRAVTDLKKSEKSVKFLEDVSNLMDILDYDQMPTKNGVVESFQFPTEAIYITSVEYLLKRPFFNSFDLEDSTFIYKLRSLIDEIDVSLRIEEHVIDHLIEDHHTLGISENLDEAGINIRAFSIDISRYGYARARKMWQLIGSMDINYEQQMFVTDLYRFVLDLSLDVTIESCLFVDGKVFQFRLRNEPLDFIGCCEIVNAKKIGLGFSTHENPMSVLVNFIGGVLGLGESWNNELYRLSEIISQHHYREEVRSIYVGDGRVTVEFN